MPEIKPKSKSAPVAQLILYPELEVKVAHREHAITAALAKQLLGWETKAEYVARCKAAKKVAKLADHTLIDENEVKVWCWNNSKNRPFSDSWARSLAQDILNRNWAGPTALGADETVNGETIVISRTGQIESGQHRLIGLVLAHQIWAKQEKWKQFWTTEPVLESVVVYGVSDSQRVLRTQDNVKPRSEADVFYTSDLFRGLSNKEKKECSRMLARAVDLLWTRTGAGERGGSKTYQTHSESVTFVGRHGGPRGHLMQAVKHLFEQNKGRQISVMRLSPGQCAGIMYLMGCGTSDGDAYRNHDPLPCEKPLDWARWEKVGEFFSLLVKIDDDTLKPVRIALAKLVDEEQAILKKHAVLALAWQAFLEDGRVTSSQVRLPMVTKDEVERLDVGSIPDFGGIDLGEQKPKDEESDPEPPTPAEVKKSKEEIRAEQVAKMQAAIAARNNGNKPATVGAPPPNPRRGRGRANPLQGSR